MHPVEQKMTRLLALVLCALALCAVRPVQAGEAHQFAFAGIDGETVSLGDFAGRAVLLVNTASFCGFTPQVAELQALWSAYRDRGLVVVATPSGDFGAQEHDTAREARDFFADEFGVDFPMTDLVSVRGADQHPFFRWAADTLGAQGAPRWNFHKILIDPNGAPVAGFPSSVLPDDPRLRAAIAAALPSAAGY